MTSKSGHYPKAVIDYLRESSVRMPPFLHELMAETEKLPNAVMATTPEQGQLLSFLIKLIGGTNVIEVGTFTGVGTLWMADAVGENGRVVACDINDDYVSIGRPYWRNAGVADRIDVRLAPACDTLADLNAAGGQGQFDFCYIDADKEQYVRYYEATLPLIRPGGVIAFDNMLLSSRVADPEIDDEAVVAIRTLTQTLKADQRVDICHISMCDGVFLVRKH